MKSPISSGGRINVRLASRIVTTLSDEVVIYPHKEFSREVNERYELYGNVSHV